jgi:phenylacetate-CoA ligase
MHPSLLKCYHALPPVLRNAAAGLRGWRLRRWRYGPETDSLVGSAVQRESWTENQWKAWQADRLDLVLNRAATLVPYYRRLWEQRRQQGDRSDWACLDNWPVLEKDAVRVNPRAFVADDCNTRRMFHEHTSGTSGTPLDLWWTRETVRSWYALMEARWRLWYGVFRRDRWAVLGGQLVTPATQRRPPFWVWNAAMQQLYMSSYHLAPDFIPHYVDALRRYRVRYLWGYTSALYALAREMIRRNITDVKMAVVITNAEPVYAYQRDAIARAFHCPVRETYGMAEIVCAASECENGKLHLWPEVGFIEILDNGQPVAAGQAGDLVCTGLLNADMPLIRYRLGDRAVAGDGEGACPCGRTLPVLTSVEGRCDDVLYALDGRAIGRMDPIFKRQLPIQEAQIVQKDWTRIEVRYVPDSGFDQRSGDAITTEIRARMGPVEVILTPVSELPRTSNGKFQAVICEISKDQLQRHLGPR